MRQPDFPELHPRVMFGERNDDDVMVLTPGGSTFTINQLQARVLQRFDGKTELEEIARACEEEFEQPVAITDIEEFVEDAKANGLLSVCYAGPVNEDIAKGRCQRVRRWLDSMGLPPPTRVPELQVLQQNLRSRLDARDVKGSVSAAHALCQASGNPAWARLIVERVETVDEPAMFDDSSRLRILIPLLDPSKLLGRVHRFFGWLYSLPGLLLVLAFFAMAGWAASSLTLPPIEALLHPGTLVVVVFASSLVAVVHELSHALTCFHFGGRVNRAGVGLMLGVMPFAYADVTSSDLFAERWKRVAVLSAGMVGSLLVMALWACIAASLPPTSVVRHGLVLTLLATSVGDVLFNLVPFIRLDGYYIASELTKIEDLHDTATDYGGALLGRLVAGPVVDVPEHSARDRAILLAYLLGAIATITGFVAIAGMVAFETLAMEWRGYGVALIVLLLLVFLAPVLVWAVVSIIAFVRTHFRAIAQPRRLARTLAVLGLPVVLPMLIQLPESATAEFEIRPIARADAIAVQGGLVSEIVVDQGQQVEAGEVVARLIDPALEREAVLAQQQLFDAEQELAIVASGPLEAERAAARAKTAASRSKYWAARRATDRANAARAALSETEVEVARSERDLARLETAEAKGAQQLVEAGATAHELEVVRARVERAKARVAEIESLQAALEVRSPIDGVIVDDPASLRRRLGAQLAPGDPLLTIHSPGLVAEIRSRWIPWGGDPRSAPVKMVLPTGRAIWSHVDELPPTVDEFPSDILLRSAPISAAELQAAQVQLRSGYKGKARLYGPRVSLLTEYVVHPVQHFFGAHLWAVL